MNRIVNWRPLAATLFAAGTVVALVPSGGLAATSQATPAAATCAGIGTPEARSTMEMPHDAIPADLDLLYIDMMIPHHASIIALSQAALPRLLDERLRALAEAVVTAQTTEIEELQGYRLEFYGSATPEPLDEHGMMQLTGDSTQPMDEMMAEMDTAAQLATFCASADPDLAFVDLTIPHHESAVVTSRVVVAQAVHPEIRDFAQRVIEAQQEEIEQLQQIRLELTGRATPAA